MRPTKREDEEIDDPLSHFLMRPTRSELKKTRADTPVSQFLMRPTRSDSEMPREANHQTVSSRAFSGEFKDSRFT
jgi:hypothetical protein